MKNTKKVIVSFLMSLTLATGILFMTASSVHAWNPFNIVVEGDGKVQEGQSLWKNQVGMGASNNVLGQPFGRSATPTDIRVIIARVVRVFLSLIGIFFLVLLVLAGYKYMMAQGDSKKAEEATSSIRHAVIGILITLSAFALTTFILDSMIATQETQGTYLFK